MNYKLAISNIAWRKDEDEEIYSLMQNNNILGLEIAPSRIWGDPYIQNESSINQFISSLKEKNINIVSLQSLLFGHPEFSIFQDEKLRTDTLEYLKKNIILAGKLNAKALVFGSPKNRIIGLLPKKEVMSIAIPFFRELGEFSILNNTCFCIEPNPIIYGGDFILTTREAIDLVKLVDNPGFKLNIDLGTISANNEDLEQTIIDALPYAGHLHISEPFLEKINMDINKYKVLKKILDKNNYDKSISIEMKSGDILQSNIPHVKEVLNFINNIYNE